MDGFFKWITWAGSLIILLPLSGGLGLLLIWRQRAVEAALVLGGLLGAALITHILKLVFARPRPVSENLLVTMPADFSFPSAHTAQVVAGLFAVGLVISQVTSGLELWLIWACMLLLAALVGYSRIYLQVHYFSDVIAGAFLGSLWVSLLYFIIKAYY